MADVTREEFNGLGGRVGKLELKVEGMSTKVTRTEADIQKIFTVSEMTQKAVDRGKWQILVMVAIPVIILVVQLFMKGK